jgi:hypothetical protein
MKTDKILHLLQQKKAMRSGGTLPLDEMQNGSTVRELWEKTTNSDWSQAKKLGLTDGSYEQNIALRNKILADLNAHRIAEKPQLVPSQQPLSPQVTALQTLIKSNLHSAPAASTSTQGIKDQARYAVSDVPKVNEEQQTKRGRVYTGVRGAIQKGVDAIDNFVNLPYVTYNNPLLPAVGALITSPVQSALNISNVISGDKPIRNDKDVVDFGWDTANILPLTEIAGIGKKAAGQALREAVYRGVEPFDYNIAQKAKDFIPNLIGNTLDPDRQLKNITEKYKLTDLHHRRAERFGKNMLDSWAIGLGLPQKYNTLEKVGENSYRIANFKTDPERFKNLWREVNRFRRNSPYQELITENARNPEFSHSIYDVDTGHGLMGQFRWDVKKLPDGNIHFQSNDKFDLHPFGIRGRVFTNPENWVDQWRHKDFNRYLQNFEALGAVGGKPYDIQNNFIIDPKTWNIIKQWKNGGQLI